MSLPERARPPGTGDERAQLTGWLDLQRWILGHMVEEVARHVGHLDLLREMLDGRTGYC